ncbi:MAG: single-stranded DNA-binding protein [Cyanobacteria bacterium P01_E01_bin.42]
MNSCTLMAEIERSPELRRTPDDTPVANMLVKFEGARENDPPGMLRVTAWRNLAEELHANYRAGDRVIVMGSLKISRIDVEKQGVNYKETRAELTLSRIYKQDGEFSSTQTSAASTPVAATPVAASVTPAPAPTSNLDNVVPIGNYNRSSGSGDLEPEPSSLESSYEDEADLDDIPF